MRYFLILWITMLCITIVPDVCAQWHIKGSLLDINKIPLEGGTVVVSVDTFSQILSHTISDELGNFELILPDSLLQKVIVQANYLGYSKQILTVGKDQTHKIEIILSPLSQNIDVVEIVSENIPIREKNDTTFYDLSAFRDSTERNLEEVLKKLPGFQIKENGTITVNGKTVEKVLFEGDDVFGRKYDIGTKTIRADMIGQVEAINHFQKNPLLNTVNTSESLVLNLKLEKDKNNILSGVATLGAGYGKNELKYTFNANLFFISKATKIIGLTDHGNSGEQYDANEISATYDELDNKSLGNPIWQSPEFVTKPTLDNPGLDRRLIDNAKSNFTTVRSVFSPSEGLKINVNALSFLVNDTQWSKNQTTFWYDTTAFNRSTFDLQKITTKTYNFDATVLYQPQAKDYAFEGYISGTLKENIHGKNLEIKEDSTTFVTTRKQLKTNGLYQGVLYTQKISSNLTLQLQEKTQFFFAPQQMHISGINYGNFFNANDAFRNIYQHINYKLRTTEIISDLFYNNSLIGIIQGTMRYINTYGHYNNTILLANENFQIPHAEQANSVHQYIESTVSVLKEFKKLQVRYSMRYFYQLNNLPAANTSNRFLKNLTYTVSLLSLLDNGGKLSGKLSHRTSPNTNILYFTTNFLKNEFEWYINKYANNDEEEYKGVVKYEKTNPLTMNSFYVQGIAYLNNPYNTYNINFDNNISIISPNFTGKSSGIVTMAHFNYLHNYSKIVLTVTPFLAKENNTTTIQDVPTQNNFYTAKLNIAAKRAFRYIIIGVENDAQHITAFPSETPQIKQQLLTWILKGSLVIQNKGWRLGTTFIKYSFFAGNYQQTANAYASTLRLSKTLLLWHKEATMEISAVNLLNRNSYKNIVNSNYLILQNEIESIPSFVICKFDYKF